MKIRNSFFVLVSFILLSGCSAFNAYQIANSTIFDPTDLEVSVLKHEDHYKKSSLNYASLFVTWKSYRPAIKNVMSGIYIYVNGKRAGAVTYNTYTVIELLPGTYKVSIGDANNQRETKVIHIKENQDKYYRAGVQPNFFVADALIFAEYPEPNQAYTTISGLTYVTLNQ